MDIQKLIDEYAMWLKSEITFEKIGEYYEITTPYLDIDNDYLQIYVRQDVNVHILLYIYASDSQLFFPHLDWYGHWMD